MPMNPERVPYAAIADLESVVKTIAQEGKGRVLILYDPQRGWWAGDEIDEATADEKTGSLLVKGRTYSDWRRETIAEALSALAAARFIPGNTVTKLFRRAPPAPPPPRAQTVAATPAAKAPAAGGEQTKSAKKADVKPAPHTKR